MSKHIIGKQEFKQQGSAERQSLMRKAAMAVGSAALLLSAASSNAIAADATFPEYNYAAGRAVAHIVKAVAEENLGLEIDTTPTGSVPVVWEAMGRGRGDIDMQPEVWLPNQQGLVSKYVKNKGTVKLGLHPYKATQGLCVTKLTREKYGVKSIYDLLNPEIADIFDTNGDGKGELYIGPNGWMSTNIEKVRARDFGYGEIYELQVMEEAAAMAKLDTAVAKGKPFVFSCYSPHHSWILHELVYLEEPAHDPAKWKIVNPDSSENWYDESHIDTSWGNITVGIAYSKTLEQRAPSLARLLDNIQMDADTVSGWIFEVGVNKRDPQEMAQEWVANNPDIVNQWLQ
jgi:glycine betaine/proline transport system substrate-binding protein